MRGTHRRRPPASREASSAGIVIGIAAIVAMPGASESSQASLLAELGPLGNL
jgi:hypothetical protein